MIPETQYGIPTESPNRLGIDPRRSPKLSGINPREAGDCLGIPACKSFKGGDHQETGFLKFVAQPPSAVGFVTST